MPEQETLHRPSLTDFLVAKERLLESGRYHSGFGNSDVTFVEFSKKDDPVRKKQCVGWAVARLLEEASVIPNERVKLLDLSDIEGGHGISMPNELLETLRQYLLELDGKKIRSLTSQPFSRYR